MRLSVISAFRFQLSSLSVSSYAHPMPRTPAITVCRKLLAILLLFAALRNGLAAPELPPEKLKPGAHIILDLPELGNSWRSGGKNPIQMKVILPKDYQPGRPHPVIVDLGGGTGGIRGADMWNGIMQGKRFLFLAVDYNTSGYNSGPAHAEYALDIIEKSVKIDRKKIVLTGSSSGAYSIGNVLRGRASGRFGAFIMIIGGGPVPTKVVGDRPVLLVAGEKDTQKASAGVSRVASQQACHDRLKAAGADSTIIIQPGVGHGFSGKHHAEVRDWIKQKMVLCDLPKVINGMRGAIAAKKWPGVLRLAREVQTIAEQGMKEYDEAGRAIESSQAEGRKMAGKFATSDRPPAQMRQFVRMWERCDFAVPIAEKCNAVGQKELDGILGAERVSPGALKRFLGTWGGFPVYDKALARYDELTRAHLEKLKAVPNKDARAKYLLDFARKWTPATCVTEALQLADDIAAAELEKVKQISSKALRTSKLRAFARKYAGTKSAEQANSLLK